MLGELIINGLLLPGGAVLVVLVLAARTGQMWLQALAVAAALVAASVGSSGVPELSSTDALGSLSYLALAAVAVTIFTKFFRESWQGWVVRLVFVMLGVGLLAESMRSHTWGTSEGLAWWVGLSVLITASWFSVERLVAERLDIAKAGAVTVALGGGAAAAAAISTLVIGIHAVAMATAVALVGLYAWRSGPPAGHLAVSAMVPIVGFLWVIAFLYGGIPGDSLVLIAFAPLLALGVLGLGRRMERSKMAIAVASTLVLVAIGSSVLVAEQSEAEMSVKADDGLDSDSGAYFPY